MVQVALGLGSNVDPVNNLHSCLDALLLRFQDLRLSSVFQSRAAGQPDWAPYLNMAVAFDTGLPLAELLPYLKSLEAKHGRNPQDSAEGRVTLDVDLLCYGKLQGRQQGVELPHPQVLTAAYVLRPLSQVLPREKHPAAGSSYAQLWRDFGGETGGLQPVDFSWHGRQLSHAN